MDPRINPRIWITADDNSDGSTIHVASAETKFTRLIHNDNIEIQCCDVMVFDQADGEPIAGATITLTRAEAEVWVKSLNALL